MEVTTKEFNRCAVVEPSGRIDSATTPQLAAVIAGFLDKGQYNLVLDMSGVDFISSAGLRVLIDTQKKCQRLSRGELVLAEVPERIYEAFDLAGFLPLFQFFDEIIAAVGAF